MNGIGRQYRSRNTVLWIVILFALMMLFLPYVAIVARAEPTKTQHAAAVVAVSNAVIEVADERPKLPSAAPMPASVPEKPDNLAETPAITPMRVEFTPEQSRKIAWANYTRRILDKSNETGKPLLVVFSASWCGPCQDMKATTYADKMIVDAIEDKFIAVHVDIDDEPELMRAFGVSKLPTLIVVENGKLGKQHVGSLNPSQMKSFLGVVETEPRPYAASGTAGAIHAASQICDSLTWWKTHIGEGVTVSARWDRTGAQTFPLLAKADWSVEALAGQYGHVQVAAVGGQFPIDSFGVGYKVSGDDVTMSIDPILFKGLAARRSAEVSASSGAAPAKLGPMTLWSIGTVLYDLYQILHPTCDLQLGGNVTCDAVLHGDMLTVTFGQSPSICIKALFTFQLSVKQVEVTERSVRIVFQGSRWIKERTFKVE